MAFFLLLRPGVPLGRELATCECGAVRAVLAGHLILPAYRQDEPLRVVQTPPLFWWAAALSTRLLGWNTLAVRLPSLIAGAATCAVLFAWLAVVAGRRAALWSVAVLSLSHDFIDTARVPRMDATLVLFVTAATICLERALASAGRRRACAGWYGGAAILMGLGTLTKGPLGIVLPLLAVGLYLVVRGRWRELMGAPLIAAVFTAIIVGGSWYLAAYMTGGMAFVRWQIIGGLWGRFLGSAGPGLCQHPFYYFVPVLFAGFLPWSVYLPVVGAFVARRRPLPEALVFSACWFAAILVFFSSSHGKCLVYVLPAFPPLAATIGITIDSFERGDERRGFGLFAAGTLAAAVFIAAIVIVTLVFCLWNPPAILVKFLHPTDRQFLRVFLGEGRSLNGYFLIWMLGSIIGTGICVRGLWRGSAWIQALGVLLISIAGILLWFGGLTPVMAQAKSLEDFSGVVNAIVPPGGIIHFAGRLEDCDLRFYTRDEIRADPKFRCGAQAEPGTYVIFSGQRWTRLTAGEASCLRLVAESGPVDQAGRRMLFVVTAPGAGPPGP